jgi:hypothetical protein
VVTILRNFTLKAADRTIALPSDNEVQLHRLGRHDQPFVQLKAGNAPRGRSSLESRRVSGFIKTVILSEGERKTLFPHGAFVEPKSKDL